MLPLTNSPAEALAIADKDPSPWVPLPTDPDRPGSDEPESYWPEGSYCCATPYVSPLAKAQQAYMAAHPDERGWMVGVPERYGPAGDGQPVDPEAPDAGFLEGPDA